jgi:hypothetical protein
LKKGPLQFLLRFFRNVFVAFLKPIAADAFWLQSAPGVTMFTRDQAKNPKISLHFTLLSLCNHGRTFHNSKKYLGSLQSPIQNVKKEPIGGCLGAFPIFFSYGIFIIDLHQ